MEHAKTKISKNNSFSKALSLRITMHELDFPFQSKKYRYIKVLCKIKKRKFFEVMQNIFEFHQTIENLRLSSDFLLY